MKAVTIETNVFPSVCYFSYLKGKEKIFIEVNDSFQKQTYRNRFDILSDQGVKTLSIPLQKYANGTATKDILVDYSGDWLVKIEKTLETCYNSSPYFEYYIDDILSVMKAKQSKLVDLNMDVLHLIKSWLDFDCDIRVTESFQKVLKDNSDYRDITLGKRKHIEHWKCDNKAYNQLFGNNFVVNLSILDLLFNQGPLSCNYIIAK